MKKRWILTLIMMLLSIGVVSCKEDAPSDSVPPTAVSNPAVQPPAQPPEISSATQIPAEPTPSPIPPTPTPQLAALVNGQYILLADYEKELARYEQAQTELGSEPDADYRSQVLDGLIEKELIRQTAVSQNILITDAAVDAKMDELRTAAGEAGNFEAWLEANHYTEAEFREALAAEMLTGEMVTAVTADVPVAVEQVRARYIQLDDPTLAQSLRDQIQAGSDFAFLAEQNSLDQVTAQNGGDLGFFARGSLLVPEVEAAAFALQPDGVSEIITAPNSYDGQTAYYIVQLIERDPQRTLTAELRYALLQQTFESWLADLKNQAVITRFIDS